MAAFPPIGAAGAALGGINPGAGGAQGAGGDVTVNQDVNAPKCPPPPPPPPGEDYVERAAAKAEQSVAAGVGKLVDQIERVTEPRLPDQERADNRVPQGAVDPNGKPIPQFWRIECPTPVDWCGAQPWTGLAHLIGGGGPINDAPFKTICGFLPQGDGQYTIPSWFVQFWGPGVGKFGAAALAIPCTICDVLDILWDCATRFCKVQKLAYFKNVFFMGITRWAARWFGFDMREAHNSILHSRQWLCPTQPLTAGQAIDAALKDDLPFPDAVNFAKADDVCEYATQKLIDSQQYHHGIGDIQELYRRGNIADANGFANALGQAGVWNPARANDLETLSHQIIDRGSAAELYNRNKPTPGQAAPQDEGSKFALITHLKQSGYTDDDAQKIATLAESPLNERRVEQMYWETIVSKDDITRLSGQNGFNAEAAKWMTDFGERMFYRHRASIMGYASAGDYSKAYKECVISAQEYKDGMSQLKFTGQEIIYALSILDLEKKWDRRRAAMHIVEQGLNKLLIDTVTAIQLLVDAGIDPSCAKTFVDETDKDNQSKHQCSRIGESGLCKAASDGLITYDNMVVALQKCGYQPVDIRVIVAQCQLNALKKAEAAAKKAEAQKARDAAKKAAAEAKADKAEKAAEAKAAKAKLAAEKAAKAKQLAEAKAALTAAKEDLAAAAKFTSEVEPSGYEKLKAPKTTATESTAATPSPLPTPLTFGGTAPNPDEIVT